MTIRNLEYLFKPKSIAVIGASDTPHSVRHRDAQSSSRRLQRTHFAGHPKYGKVAGVRAFPSVASLEETPDLAVICTPPPTVPGLIAQLGSRGTKAAVVLSAGLAAIKDGQGRSLQETMLEAARPHLLRILGPNCVGLLIPGSRSEREFCPHRRAAGHHRFCLAVGSARRGAA